MSNFHSHETDKGWSLRHLKPQEIMGFYFADYVTKEGKDFDNLLFYKVERGNEETVSLVLILNLKRKLAAEVEVIVFRGTSIQAYSP